MDTFGTFLMEEPLESSRFESRFNLGESGARPVTVGELLEGSGIGSAEAARALLGMSLRDSPNWGRPELRDAVARLHPGSRRDNVLITTGTSEALLLLFRQLRPRRTALATPAFQLLHEIPRSLGSEIIDLPVRWDANGRPFVRSDEWGEILARMRPDCIIINTPHNPSGLIVDPALVALVLESARASGATVIADELYRFFASEDSVLGETLYRSDSNLFVTGSFLKCLGCPGLRIGWCVGDPAVLARMQSEKNYTTHTVNPLSEWIALEVIKDLSSPAITRQRDLWKQNRRTLAAYLRQSECFYGRAPDGGLVTSIGFRGAIDERDVDRRMHQLSRAGVFVLALRHMDLSVHVGRKDIDPIGRGWGFRLGLGASAALFEEALEVMERWGR